MPTKKQPDNPALARWERLAKTDPKHTKPFNRGGFKGTALKPIWLIKRMTEEFGTAGEAWGMLEPRFETIFIPDVEPQVYCIAGMWIGSRENTIYGVGGDTMVRTFKSGDSVADDEAFKKAYTDAINNCFKYLGIGGDVHMGQFEDSKYVTAMNEEFDTELETITDFIEAINLATSMKELEAAAAKHGDAVKALANGRLKARVAQAYSTYSQRKEALTKKAA